MSRIGNRKLEVPAGVTVSIDNNIILRFNIIYIT